MSSLTNSADAPYGNCESYEVDAVDIVQSDTASFQESRVRDGVPKFGETPGFHPPNPEFADKNIRS